MKENNIENAKIMVGPAFEELDDSAMQETDGAANPYLTWMTYLSIMRIVPSLCAPQIKESELYWPE